MADTIMQTNVYNSLFHYHHDACYALDLEGKFTLFNEAASEITGYTPEEAFQMTFFSLMEENRFPTAFYTFAHILKGNQQNFKTSIVTKYGKKMDLEISALPLYENGKIVGVAGIAHDNTEQNNLAVLLKGQNKILELVTRGCPFSEVMNHVVYLVEEVSDGVVGSIHLKDSKENLLHRCSAPNLPEEYKNFIKEIPIGPSSGSCGTAAYKKEPILCSDIAHDALWKEYKTMALKHGLRACWSSPVFDNRNNVLGIFAMYYDKPCLPSEWDKQVVKEATYLISLVIQHYLAEEKINYIAFHDELTGLPNRRLFEKRVVSAIENYTDSSNYKLGIMYIDLDRFKIINDSLGQNLGDMLLKQVARRLQSCVLEYDVVSRQGGDEFAILLHDRTQLELSTVAQRIINEVAKPFLLINHEVFVTPSIGISMHPPDGSDSFDLFRKADIAMYQAKKAGRNNYQFYNPELSRQNHQRLELENDLRKALTNNEFALHYQPIFDIAANKMTGVEALIRWKHPKLGVVSPAEFIPIAEETGMIVPIGEWVLKTACQQLMKWEKEKIIVPSVAVNISFRQFYQPDFVHNLACILADTRINPANLTIEITESMTMDVEKAINLLYELKKLKVNISIDDFGTGYSSLNYLKTFPIDYLKIDQSFIRDITKSLNDEKIATTILLMAQNLGLGVIAEGVETPEQFNILMQHGCNQAQGYLFSKPLSPEKLSVYVNQVAPHL